MTSYLRYISFLTTLLVLSGCVHQFPEEPSMRKVHLSVTHIQEWTRHDMDILSRASSDDNGYVVRYIFRAYPEGMLENMERPHVWERIIYRDEMPRSDFDIDLDMPVGDWELHVWSDIVSDKDLKDRYYSVSDFTMISLLEPHSGCDDMRDAFAGSAEVHLPGGPEEAEPEYVSVSLERPLARYEFIATDFDEFIRQKNERDNSGISVDEYEVEFYYCGYMPSAYNRFSDDVTDAKPGVMFKGRITRLSDTEASIGFDHVFVNHRERYVIVSAVLVSPDGSRSGLTGEITIPLLRSRCTVVRGRFLTADESGGINMDVEFEGDHNIYI